MTSLAQLLRPLDPKGSLPLYQQLQRALREAIETRALGPDDALPAERQLDPHVDYFLARNPGHERGDELVCLTEIRAENLTPAGLRMVRAAGAGALP